MRLPSVIKKWHLTLRIIPLLSVILALKVLFHGEGWEFISLNPLFTSLIAATIFLIGFLTTGVIADYKESEKIPGDMAASLEALRDEVDIAHQRSPSADTAAFLVMHAELVRTFEQWFYRTVRTRSIIQALHDLNVHFAHLEDHMPANFLVRMKNDQALLRKLVVRVDHIRDMSFIQSAYAIVEVLAFFVITGLLILDMPSFLESLFFTGLVSFLMIYMIFLIRDLDNPFDYSEHGEQSTEVSLKPLHDLAARVDVPTTPTTTKLS